jgi:hypothetical protein
MLQCENPKNGLKAIFAFFRQQRIPRARRREWDYTFEHGQLWIIGQNGAQFSVVDAKGGPSVDGFDFEQVTDADED